MKRIIALMLAVLMCVALLPATALAADVRTVKTNSGAPLVLRSGPAATYNKLGTVPNGAKVTVKETSGNWVRVSVNANGKTGWVSATYLVSGNGGSSGNISGTKGKLNVRTVSNSILNVRTGAGQGYTRLYTLEKGDVMKVLETSKGWYRIETFDGITGWVAGNLTTSGAKATVTRVYVNLRKSNTQSSKKLGELYKGDKVKVDYVNGSYAHVTCGSQKGFVHLNFLQF